MTTNPRYHRWFDLGAESFRSWALARGAEELLPDDGEPVYPCPLCTREYTKDDLVADRLTPEHVPPESVGGRRLVLTCGPCNHGQGSSIDSHAPKREAWIDSHMGGRVTPIRGEHTIGGVTVRGEIWAGAGQYGFAYVAKMNNPNEHEAYLRAFDDPANTKSNFRELPGFVWGQADLSYVRAAYLASFAVCGWTHILRPAYRPLRRLFAGDPTTELPPAIVRYSPEETSRTNQMFLVTETGPQQGVLIVTMGRSMVTLPGPRDPRGLDEVADAFATLVPNGESRTFNGLLVDWPTEPMHGYDPDPPEGGSDAAISSGAHRESGS